LDLEQLDAWLEIRGQLPIGAVPCVIHGPAAGRRWDASAARKQLHHVSPSISNRSNLTAQQRDNFDATSASLFAVIIAATCSERSPCGLSPRSTPPALIRSTFTAMPARRLVLASNAAPAEAFALSVALFCDVGGFALGQRLVASQHLQVALSHPGVPRAIVFGACREPCRTATRDQPDQRPRVSS
jgi:hypothetical protein